MSNAGLDLWACFERDGYVVVTESVTAEVCDAAAEGVEAFKERNRRVIARNVDGANRMYRVVDLHAVVESLQLLFTDNAALALCDRFFGEETALHSSLFFERGSEQELHRDSPSNSTRPEGRCMEAWVAIEDVDAHNGPLVVVPGSHRLPALDIVQMATDLYGSPDAAPRHDHDGWYAYQRAAQAQCEEYGLAPVEQHVHKGDTIVWHPLLLHGGAPQRSASRTRRSIVFNVTPPYTAVYGQDVFFDPERCVEGTVSKAYTECHGRKVPGPVQVDFAHEFAVRATMLHRPDGDLAGWIRTTGQKAKHWARERRRALNA